MRLKQFRLPLATLLLAVTCGSAQAQQTEVVAAPALDPARTGWYLGLGGQYSLENFDSAGADFDDGYGFNVRLGGRVLRHLAIEAEIENNMGFSAGPAEYKSWLFTLNAKGYLMTGKWQPFVLGGMGLEQGQVKTFGITHDETGFGMRFGGGMDWFVMETITLGLDVSYIVNVGSLSDFDMAVFGLNFQYHA